MASHSEFRTQFLVQFTAVLGALAVALIALHVEYGKRAQAEADAARDATVSLLVLVKSELEVNRAALAQMDTLALGLTEDSDWCSTSFTLGTDAWQVGILTGVFQKGFIPRLLQKQLLVAYGQISQLNADFVRLDDMAKSAQILRPSPAVFEQIARRVMERVGHVWRNLENLILDVEHTIEELQSGLTQRPTGVLRDRLAKLLAICGISWCALGSLLLAQRFGIIFKGDRAGVHTEAGSFWRSVGITTLARGQRFSYIVLLAGFLCLLASELLR